MLPAGDFERLSPRLPSTVRVVASAEEFNVRFERMLERQRTPGRVWVLVASAGSGGAEGAADRPMTDKGQPLKAQ